MEKALGNYSEEITGLFEVFGKKWALRILYLIMVKDYEKDSIRFNELKKALPGISSTMLSKRLAELETKGLISKTIYPEVPIRVEYRITSKIDEVRAFFAKFSECPRYREQP